MKNQKIKTIFNWSFAICLLLISACYLDETNPGIVTLEYSSLEDFFDAKGAELQIFEEDAANDILVTGKLGTVVQIAASDIVNTNGQNPTGKINVKLREIYTKSKMVISNMPTSSQGEVLESGGEIYLELTEANGNELSLKNGATALTRLPLSDAVSNPNEMNMFFGIEDGGFSWIPSTNNTVTFDSVGQSFDMITDRFGWINCDYFYNSAAPKTTVKIKPSVSGNLVDVGAFIVFSDINSVMGMNYSKTDKEFSKANIPTDHEVSIVVIGIDEESFFFAKETVSITENLNLTLNLNLVSESELINSLNALN